MASEIKKAVIIGAGIGGIATAIRLAKKGYETEVFESNAYPGGKLSEIHLGDYRFDAGPSLFTMPHYVTELFELAGRAADASFTYEKLAEHCRYFYPDGTRFTVDDALRGPEVSRHASALKSYYKKSRRIWEITSHVFLEKSLHRISTYLSLKTFLSVLQLGRIDAFRTMHKANEASFTDKNWVQFADRFATYNGSDPYQAPATLNVIPHLEHAYGSWFPKGGMYAIVKSLVGLAETMGVKFHYKTAVERIVHSGRKVSGIEAAGKFHAADVVVSNGDVWFTYKKLLQKEPHLWPKRIIAQERSSSALIFYWGVKRVFPELGLHNIFFSGDYRKEFETIWKEKSISADPTVYINISSNLEPKDAPPGCENWFVMINVPANAGQNWDELIATARRNIICKISKELGVDIEPLIEAEDRLDPRRIESRTSAYQGALYGNSSNSRFAAFLRHANRSSKLRNLYFCGGSVHPGGGIPLSLLSAKIVADWIK